MQYSQDADQADSEQLQTEEELEIISEFKRILSLVAQQNKSLESTAQAASEANNKLFADLQEKLSQQQMRNIDLIKQMHVYYDHYKKYKQQNSELSKKCAELQRLL